MSQISENFEEYQQENQVEFDNAINLVINDLRSFLVNRLDCTPEEVHVGTKFGALKLDSLDLLEIAIYAEKKHGLYNANLSYNIQKSTVEGLAKLIVDA